jgi:hypothetical protein
VRFSFKVSDIISDQINESDRMGILFKAKLEDAHAIKTLSEIIKYINSESCVIVSSESERIDIVVSAADTNQVGKFCLNNFRACKIPTDDVIFGLDFSKLYDGLKSVKKKTLLTFYMTSENSSNLMVEITSATGGGKDTISIGTQKTKKISLKADGKYDRRTKVQTTEFQTLCKNLKNVNSQIAVTSSKRSIKFTYDKGQIHSRTTEFTEGSDDEEDEDSDEETTSVSNVIQYQEMFQSRQIIKLNKISAMSKYMTFNTGSKKPLKLSFDISNIGSGEIYIRSVETMSQREVIQKELKRNKDSPSSSPRKEPTTRLKFKDGESDTKYSGRSSSDEPSNELRDSDLSGDSDSDSRDENERETDISQLDFDNATSEESYVNGHGSLENQDKDLNRNSPLKSQNENGNGYENNLGKDNNHTNTAVSQVVGNEGSRTEVRKSRVRILESPEFSPNKNSNSSPRVSGKLKSLLKRTTSPETGSETSFSLIESYDSCEIAE